VKTAKPADVIAGFQVRSLYKRFPGTTCLFIDRNVAGYLYYISLFTEYIQT